jgi:hypothetical protein
VKIRLLMLVERDPQGQFTGVIFQEGKVRPGCFSGTAELVKVMEEVLPLERPLVKSARSAGPHTGCGSAPEPAGG